MTWVLHDAYPIGVDKVVQVPEKVAGHFDFGELELAIDMCLKCNLQQERAHYQAVLQRELMNCMRGVVVKAAATSTTGYGLSRS